MTNQGRPETVPPDAERRARVTQLVELSYSGSQRRAARSWGVSQALISKVINGVQPVTDRLLEVVARQPGVNPRWLFDGQGDPLLPSTAGTLPVSTLILPGSPEKHRSLLSAERYAVTTHHERESRYWLRLDSRSPILVYPGLLLREDDLLLIETHRDHLDRLDVVAEQLCAITIRQEAAFICVLAYVMVTDGTLLAEVFDHGLRAIEAPTGELINSATRGSSAIPKKPRRRTISSPRPRDFVAKPHDLVGSTPIPSGNQLSSSGGSWLRLSGVEDIVGVALMLSGRRRCCDIKGRSPTESLGNLGDLASGGQKNQMCHEQRLVRLTEVQPKPLSWVWPGYLAVGAITDFSGDPGAGKSWIA